MGTQLVDDLPAHEARSAIRRLVASLFDAWDAGDVAGVVAHFTPDAMWTDPSGARSFGTDDLVAHYVQWRGWEPFSVHWVNNEQVLVDDERHATGTWLWSAASNIDGGATAAWSGGDLAVRFESTDAGWRIASLVMSDRYRSPYATGWLVQQLVVPELGPRTGDPATTTRCGVVLEGLPAPAPPGPVDPVGDPDARTARLHAESAVRWAIGEYADAVEVGRDRSELAAHLVEDVEYTSDLTATVVGREQVLDAHAAEAARVAAWIRAQMSVAIEVDAGLAHASCHWRELWTAEVAGRPRWIAQAVAAELQPDPSGWRLRRLRRQPLLDCSYQEGWLTAPAVPAQESPPVVEETRVVKEMHG